MLLHSGSERLPSQSLKVATHMADESIVCHGDRHIVGVSPVQVGGINANPGSSDSTLKVPEFVPGPVEIQFIPKVEEFWRVTAVTPLNTWRGTSVLEVRVSLTETGQLLILRFWTAYVKADGRQADGRQADGRQRLFGKSG